MKQFLKTNTMTYNLMSFTGFKSLLLFSLLLSGPKSYAQIQEIWLNHEYLRENVSVDALRIYMNSLKEMGCKIARKMEDGVAKYYITEVPFKLKITSQQAKSIIKIYKAIAKSIEIEDLMTLQQFFNKIADYVDDNKLKEKLANLSPFNHISSKLVEELKIYAKNNNEITIYYHSLHSGNKDITILVDKLKVLNGRLYVCGMNSEYNNYSSFLVARIIKIKSVNIKSKTLIAPEIIVRYELKKVSSVPVELLENEKIIEQDDKKYVIEMTSRNRFDILQRIMSHTNKCKVLSPDSIRNEVIYTLKKMKEGYIG